MAPSALALDIDGTLDTADAREVTRLRAAAKKYGADVQINTARPLAYCARPDRVSTDIVGAKTKHHCLIDPYPPTSKVKNMEKIQKSAKVRQKKCVVLIDDRPENVSAVRRAQFSAIKVDERTGIRKSTVDKAIDQMRQCAAAESRSRGLTSTESKHRVGIALVVIIAILIALGVFVKSTRRVAWSVAALTVAGALIFDVGFAF